ncbi:hypothetical protein FG386_000890 [Cryptosporidium ryanae]|uniref:uncharacterized protein n=1 Tax=Cryptosporidium ryanae TaxID=515981 RepID=UPI00351A2C74|nr:hypothetical protein FG386_000890 [Cryptosporidium ryanae]
MTLNISEDTKNERKLPLLKLEKVKKLFNDNESKSRINELFSNDEHNRYSSDSSSNFTTNLSVPQEPELINSKSISNKYDDLSANQIRNRMLKKHCFSMIPVEWESENESDFKVKHSHSQVDVDEYFKNLVKYDFVIPDTNKRINLLEGNNNPNKPLIRNLNKSSKKLMERIKIALKSLNDFHENETEKVKIQDKIGTNNNKSSIKKNIEIVPEEKNIEKLLLKNKSEILTNKKEEKVIFNKKQNINKDILYRKKTIIKLEQEGGAKLKNINSKIEYLKLDDKPSDIMLSHTEGININNIDNILINKLNESLKIKSENDEIKTRDDQANISSSNRSLIISSIKREIESNSDLNFKDKQTLINEKNRKSDSNEKIRDKLSSKEELFENYDNKELGIKKKKEVNVKEHKNKDDNILNNIKNTVEIVENDNKIRKNQKNVEENLSNDKHKLELSKGESNDRNTENIMRNEDKNKINVEDGQNGNLTYSSSENEKAPNVETIDNKQEEKINSKLKEQNTNKDNSILILKKNKIKNEDSEQQKLKNNAVYSNILKSEKNIKMKPDEKVSINKQNERNKTCLKNKNIMDNLNNKNLEKDVTNNKVEDTKERMHCDNLTNENENKGSIYDGKIKDGLVYDKQDQNDELNSKNINEKININIGHFIANEVKDESDKQKQNDIILNREDGENENDIKIDDEIKVTKQDKTSKPNLENEFIKQKNTDQVKYHNSVNTNKEIFQSCETINTEKVKNQKEIDTERSFENIILEEEKVEQQNYYKIGELIFKEELKNKVEQRMKKNSKMAELTINLNDSLEVIEDIDKLFDSRKESFNMKDVEIERQNNINKASINVEKSKFGIKTKGKQDSEFRNKLDFISKKILKGKNLKFCNSDKPKFDEELREKVENKFRERSLTGTMHNHEPIEVYIENQNSSKVSKGKSNIIVEKLQDKPEFDESYIESTLKLKDMESYRKEMKSNHLKKEPFQNELCKKETAEIKIRKSNVIEKSELHMGKECQINANLKTKGKIKDICFKEINSQIGKNEECKNDYSNVKMSEIRNSQNLDIYKESIKKKDLDSNLTKDCNDCKNEDLLVVKMGILNQELKKNNKPESTTNVSTNIFKSKVEVKNVKNEEKNPMQNINMPSDDKSNQIEQLNLNNKLGLNIKDEQTHAIKGDISNTKSDKKDILKSKWSEMIKSKSKVPKNKKKNEAEYAKEKVQLNNIDKVILNGNKSEQYVSSGPSLKKIFTLEECIDDFSTIKGENKGGGCLDEEKGINLEKNDISYQQNIYNKKLMLNQKRRLSLKDHLKVPVIQTKKDNSNILNFNNTRNSEKIVNNGIFTPLNYLCDKFKHFFILDKEQEKNCNKIFEDKINDTECLVIKPFISKYSNNNIDIFSFDNHENSLRNKYKNTSSKNYLEIQNNVLTEVDKLLTSDFSSIETKRKMEIMSNKNENIIKKSLNRNKISKKRICRNMHNPTDLKALIKKQEIMRLNSTNKNLKISLMENTSSLNQYISQDKLGKTRVRENKNLENESSVITSSIDKYEDFYMRNRVKRNFHKITNNLDLNLIENEMKTSVCSCHICSLHNDSNNKIDPITLHILREEMKIKRNKYTQINSKKEKNENINKNVPKHYHKHYHYGGDKLIKLSNGHCYRHHCKHKHKRNMNKSSNKRKEKNNIEAGFNENFNQNKEQQVDNTLYGSNTMALLKEQIKLILKEQGVIGNENNKNLEKISDFSKHFYEFNNLSQLDNILNNKEERIIRVIKENYEKEYSVLQDINRNINCLRIDNNNVIHSKIEEVLEKPSNTKNEKENEKKIKSDQTISSINVENDVMKRNIIHMKLDLDKIKQNMMEKKSKHSFQRRNANNIRGLKKKSVQNLLSKNESNYNEIISMKSSESIKGKTVKKSISKSSKQQASESAGTSTSWFSGWFGSNNNEEKKKETVTENNDQSINSNNNYSDAKATKATSSENYSVTLEDLEHDEVNNQQTLKQNTQEENKFWSWIGYSEEPAKSEQKPKALKETQKSISKTYQQKLKRKQSNKLSKQQSSPPPSLPPSKPKAEVTSWFSNWFGSAVETPPAPPPSPAPETTPIKSPKNKSKSKKGGVKRPPPLKPVDDISTVTPNNSVKTHNIKKAEPNSVKNVPPPPTPTEVSWFSSWFGGGLQENNNEIYNVKEKNNEDLGNIENSNDLGESNSILAENTVEKTSIENIPSIKVTSVVTDSSLVNNEIQDSKQEEASFFTSWFGGASVTTPAPPPTPINNVSEKIQEQEETSWFSSWFTSTPVANSPQETRQPSPQNKKTEPNQTSKTSFEPNTEFTEETEQSLINKNSSPQEENYNKNKNHMITPEKICIAPESHPEQKETSAESSWFSGWFGGGTETTPAPPPTPTAEPVKQSETEASSWLEWFGGTSSTTPPPPPTPTTGTLPEGSSWFSGFGW